MAGYVETGIASVATGYKALRQSNNYQFDVQLVSRHMIEPASLASTDIPAIFVVRAPGPSQIILEDKYFYKQKTKVWVLGFYRDSGQNPDAEQLATVAEAFLSDIKKLAMADPLFGGTATSQIWDSTILDDKNDAGHWDNVSALVGITLQLTTFFDGVTP